MRVEFNMCFYSYFEVLVFIMFIWCLCLFSHVDAFNHFMPHFYSFCFNWCMSIQNGAQCIIVYFNVLSKRQVTVQLQIFSDIRWELIWVHISSLTILYFFIKTTKQTNYFRPEIIRKHLRQRLWYVCSPFLFYTRLGELCNCGMLSNF